MSAPRLLVTVPEGVHYRADAIEAGALALGMQHTRDTSIKPAPGDAIICWNLHRGQREIVERWAGAGASVIVMENGYIGADESGHQLYAMARDSHNGSGRWLIGGFERWEALNIPAAKYIDYTRQGYTLVVGQRGIGSPTMRSPSNWHQLQGAEAAQRYWPGSPIRIREHPGRLVPAISLEDDLAGAARVLIWSSAVGVAAIVQGIPVYYAAPYWIGRPSAVPFDRLAIQYRTAWPLETRFALRSVAWAQWTLAEIASGQALARLLMLA